MAKEEQTQEVLLFQAVLGIQPPWFITNIDLKQENNELHIILDFEKICEFPSTTCGTSCKCYNPKEKTWKHLSFFQYRT